MAKRATIGSGLTDSDGDVQQRNNLWETLRETHKCVNPSSEITKSVLSLAENWMFMEEIITQSKKQIEKWAFK